LPMLSSFRYAGSPAGMPRLQTRGFLQKWFSCAMVRA
jgi:hypothetical protein